MLKILMTASVFLLVGSITVTEAQVAGPTLTETLAWIASTYNAHDGGSFGHEEERRYVNGRLFSHRSESVSFNGCQIGLQIQDDPSSPLFSDIYATDSASFNLGSVDPESIKIVRTESAAAGLQCYPDSAYASCDSARVTFETRNQIPLINENYHAVFQKLKGKDHNIWDQRKTFVQKFYISDVDYTDRFEKAFRHAVLLCGGRPSTF